MAVYTNTQIHRSTQTLRLWPEKMMNEMPWCWVQLSPSKLTAGETDLSGFVWDRVNFLLSSQYGSMFWLCGWNCVDKIFLFGCYWKVLAPPQHAKLSFFPHCSTPVRRSGLGRERGVGTTSNYSWPTWTKSSFIPCNKNLLKPKID